MPSILQGRLPIFALVALGIVGILFVLGIRMAFPSQSEELTAFQNLWSCLLVGELFYHIYIAISGVEYRPYFVWYRSPSFVFWIITASLICLFAVEHIKLGKLHLEPSRWIPVGLSLAVFSSAVYLFARSVHFTSDLYAARYDAALWIAENSPPETIFAAWNTGQLGYFSNRTFINLDGVINNVDYYERVLRGSIPLTDYLFENNVAYIVDYSTYGSIPDFPVVHSFPVNDGSGEVIRIWQVPPSISLAQ